MRQLVWVYVCVDRKMEDGAIIEAAEEQLGRFYDIEYEYLVSPRDDETIITSIWGNGLILRPTRTVRELAEAHRQGYVNTPDALAGGRWHEEGYDNYPTDGVKPWSDRVSEHLDNWANAWDDDEFVGMIVPFQIHP